MRHLHLFILIFFFAAGLFFNHPPSLAQSPNIAPEIIWSQLPLDFEEASSVVWSPDGQYLAISNDETNHLHIFDWQARRTVQSYPLDISAEYERLEIQEWSPDGGKIAAIFGGNAYIIDVQAEPSDQNPVVIFSQVSTPPEYLGGRWTNVKWDPDSDHFALLAIDGYIYIFSAITFELQQIIDIVTIPYMRGEGIGYIEFDWSPDGRWLVALSASEGIFIGIWDVSGNLVMPSELSNEISEACSTIILELYGGQLAWANDSRTLAILGDIRSSICTFNVDGTITFQKIETYNIYPVWSPNQRWLISYNSNLCSIAITDTVTSTSFNLSVPPVDNEPCVGLSLDWSPDSQYIVAVASRELWMGRLSNP